MAQLKDTVINGILVTGSGKAAWNDGVAGAYLGTDGSIQLTSASAGGKIGFHYAGNTNADIVLQQTSSGTLYLNGTMRATTMMCGNKIGYLDGNTGIYIKDEGYMHLQRSNGNPYLGFICGTGTAMSGSIGMNDANTIYVQTATNFVPYTTNKIALGGTGNVWERCAAKYYFAGLKTYSDANASMYTYWKDGAVHDMIQRNADGLNLYVGWTGSSTYSTKVILQAQAYKLGSASGTTISSDKNLKKDFSDFDEKWEEFYMNLKPLTYKYKLGTSDRTHCGFVTQEVEEALISSGLTTKDFGGVNIYKLEHREIETDYNNSDGDHIVNKDIENSNVNYLLDQGITEEHDLIYSEFIALNTHMIQKIKREIAELKAEIVVLKNS